MNHKLKAEDGEILQDQMYYRKLVGSLLYLTLSRPDIAYAVFQSIHAAAQTSSSRCSEKRRIQKYVKGSPGRGLSIFIQI